MSLHIMAVEKNYSEINEKYWDAWDKDTNTELSEGIEYASERLFYGQFFNLRCALAKTLDGWKYYYNHEKHDTFEPRGMLTLLSDENTPNYDILMEFFLMSDSEFEISNREVNILYRIFKDKKVEPDKDMVNSIEDCRERVEDGYRKLMSIFKTAIDNDGMVIGC